MTENIYFEGSETFYADIEFESRIDDDLSYAPWVSQR